MSASLAATRIVDVLLRSAGGRSITLRTPAPAVAADITEQLGLAVPSFQDVSLAPVVFRRARAVVANGRGARWELLVSAKVVEQLIGSLAYGSASVLFATAFGVLVDGDMFEIESVTQEQAFGEPYVYRLVLQAALTQVT